MPYFYFDESLHPTADFIIGAFVGSREDKTVPVQRALVEAGLRPGVDEYKSGVRMQDNPSMRKARDLFHDVLSDCRIGVVVAPAHRRQDFGLEALRGLHKILTSTGLDTSGHSVFLDQGLVNNRATFDALVAELGLSENTIQIEQDSVLIAGLQLADMVTHTCATMLRAQMGLVTKLVKAGENSGYEPNDDIDLAFMLWGSLRSNFFAAPPPPPQEWKSQLDWQADVESRGLYIAESCSKELKAVALERFGKMYLGCTH